MLRSASPSSWEGDLAMAERSDYVSRHKLELEGEAATSLSRIRGARGLEVLRRQVFGDGPKPFNNRENRAYNGRSGMTLRFWSCRAMRPRKLGGGKCLGMIS